MGIRLWLRWSWRDLRKRPAQVGAIAAIIALGAGIYAGLGSTSVWRRESLDATFARSAAHDVKVSLVPGTSIEPARLDAAIRAAGGGGIRQVETRLVLPAPVSVRHRGTTIVAAGELVGVDVERRHHVDRWTASAGRDLSAADRDVPIGLLDEHFAREHDLPTTGELLVGGDVELAYVGTVLSPEYLNPNVTSGEAIHGAATRAVVFAPLATVQEVAGLPGRVNDAVIRAERGTNVERLAASLRRELAVSLPDTAVTVTTRQSEPLVRALYDEIDSEQQIFDVFAYLVLAGAGFAAFNLTRRVVEAQRRDIGIAMALGLSPSRIAIRTMFLAAEITAVGMALGVLVGWIIGEFVLSVITRYAPLPVLETPFQGGLFAEAALLALIVPMAAAAYPVWRAVQVSPIDTLVPPHLRGGRHRLTNLLRHLRLPGTITMQAPLRRTLRAPMRSLLTILALGFVIAPLLAAFGTTDSATATIDAGQRLLVGSGGDRLLVDLSTFQPASSPTVSAIEGASGVRRAEAGINIGGYVSHDGTRLGVSLSMVDLDSAFAAPASIAGRDVPPGGIVLSAKAADDLHVRTGQTVLLRHPQRVGAGYRFVETRVPVTAVHRSPYRFVAYMDLSDAGLMGLTGLVNTVKVEPRDGVSIQRTQAQLMTIPGVASVLRASTLSNTMRDLLADVQNLFILLQVIIAALALLIAFNTSNLAVEERARENATMFAFGIPLKRIVGMGVAESVALAAVGVAVGLALGVAVLEWVLTTVFPAAIPDLAVLRETTTQSYLVTIGIGLFAAAAAPLFNVRKLRRMSIPDTIRYVE
jgi:putative ABC transport system permease protein